MRRDMLICLGLFCLWACLISLVFVIEVRNYNLYVETYLADICQSFHGNWNKETLQCILQLGNQVHY